MALRVTLSPAPLARRMLAFWLDGVVLVPIWIAYASVLDAAFGPLVAVDPAGTSVVVVAIDAPRVALELILTLLTDAAYFAGSWVRWGMTPGQRVFGVAVRALGPARPRAAGGLQAPGPASGRVTLQAASVRWAVLQLVPLCVGSLGSAGAMSIEVVAGITATWSAFLLLSAAADPLRRALHDRVAGTIVVPAAVLRRS